MSRFIKSILLFIPFMIAMYILMICFWGNYAPRMLKRNLTVPYNNTFTRLQDAKQTKNIDILFTGSSHAYRGFDTRIFKNAGYASFNLGSSAQTPLQTEALLKRYLDQLNPKIIIYDVYAGLFSADGVESSLDIIANDKNDNESISLAIEQNHIKVYNTLIYCSYSDLFNKSRTYKIKRSDHYITGGFVQKDLKYFKNVQYDKNEWHFKSTQFHSFENTIKLIKERNIRLVFVQIPTTHSYYQSFTNNEIFDSKMHAYGEYYNFNSLVQLDDSLDFYDSQHLNQNGVEKFNKKLIETLFVKK